MSDQTDTLLTQLMTQLAKHNEDSVQQQLDLREIKTKVSHVADTVQVLDEIVMTGRGGQPPLSQAVPQLTLMIETFVQDQKSSNAERRRLTAAFRAAIIPAVISSLTALIIAIVTLVTK